MALLWESPSSCKNRKRIAFKMIICAIVLIYHNFSSPENLITSYWEKVTNSKCLWIHSDKHDSKRSVSKGKKRFGTVYKNKIGSGSQKKIDHALIQISKQQFSEYKYKFPILAEQLVNYSGFCLILILYNMPTVSEKRMAFRGSE